MDEQAQIIIATDYREWLVANKKPKYYGSLDKAFEFLCKNGGSYVECNFRCLLPKLIVAERTDEIKKLIGFIRCTICKYEWSHTKGNRNDSNKTHLKAFLNYAESLISNKQIKEIAGKLKDAKCSLSLSDDVDKKMKDAFNNRIIYSNDDLRNKFKSRLRRQDRTSGEKIWLPLGFIANIYNPKRIRGRIDNDYTKWLDSLVNDVYVHYLDTVCNKVCSAKFKDEKLYLELIKEDNDAIEYSVNVILSKGTRKGKCFPALTPTGNGNQKVLMKVTKKNLESLDIDHIKPIDLTLRDLGDSNQLNCLKQVSDKYKELQNSDNLNEDNVLKFFSSNKNFKDCLRKELGRIREDGLLRLMDSKYNSQKSNGDTFQRIIKIAKKFEINKIVLEEGSLLGVLEENVVIRDKYGDQVFLVQELTDTFKQNGYMVIPQMPDGLDINGRAALEKYINYI